MEANVESLENLRLNLAEQGYDMDKTPCVIQYNKRDLPNAAPIADLQAAVNPGWPVADPVRMRNAPDPYHEGEYLVSQCDGQWVEKAPWFEAVAMTGEGVFDTLKAVSKLVVKSLG